MKRTLIWLLMLVMLAGLTAAVAAQDGASDENACNAGGSLEGRCDWPTDAEDDWAWTCGWYIAHFESGEFGLSGVPEWCNYFVEMPVVCYDSDQLGQRDFMLTGALNTVNNATGYGSFDGSCSGGTVFDTVVTGSNTPGGAESALATCESLFGPSVSGVVNMHDALGYNTPDTWWGCLLITTT
jgi:hypothetical protein